MSQRGVITPSIVRSPNRPLRNSRSTRISVSPAAPSRLRRPIFGLAMPGTAARLLKNDIGVSTSRDTLQENCVSSTRRFDEHPIAIDGAFHGGRQRRRVENSLGDGPLILDGKCFGRDAGGSVGLL